MKRLLIVGPPGAGKGTQAAFITKEANIPHISTGDMFREALKNETELGKLAKAYMDKGELVPDSLTINIVKERFLKPDCQNGFLLDGFPRNIEQAKALDEMLETLGWQIDKVLNINIANEALIGRIVGRRVCKNCGATYHIEKVKPKIEGVCDICSGELYQRKDDMPETVQNRLEVYAEKTKPIIEYYKNKVINIEGDRTSSEVFQDIKKVLGV